MADTTSALVAVIMGSRSDLRTMQPAIDLLSELEIPHEVRIVSAHRTPDWMFGYAASAALRWGVPLWLHFLQEEQARATARATLRATVRRSAIGG